MKRTDLEYKRNKLCRVTCLPCEATFLSFLHTLHSKLFVLAQWLKRRTKRGVAYATIITEVEAMKCRGLVKKKDMGGVGGGQDASIVCIYELLRV